jgi:predicted SnoaL-like aldol condensation-catalyzing enzyme
MDTELQKKAAIEFLQLVIDGQIDKAYQKHINMNGKHHNTYTPAGFVALQKGMTDADIKFPNKQFTIKHVVGEKDLVVVHSHLILKEGDPGLITMHMFLFDDDKIVEMWDMTQPVPIDSPNNDGAF